VLFSDIGAVAGDFLGVLLVVRVLSVSVTQDPNANRHAQTSQTPMNFFIPTVYRKQIHRASKQSINPTTAFSINLSSAGNDSIRMESSKIIVCAS
jgi:hypothetical protein